MRLRKFETQGVEATVEVQNAARRVARENTLLRSLLSLAGVTDSEVEEFLYRGERAGGMGMGVVYPVVEEGEGGEGREGEGKGEGEEGWERLERDMGMDMDMTPGIDMEMGMQGASRLKMMKMRQGRNQSYMAPTNHDHEPMYMSRHTERPTSDSTQSLFSERTEPKPQSTHPSTPCSNDDPPYATDTNANTTNANNNTISCERAASIIAGMRGHYDNDNEKIRAELGCSSNGMSCTVENMRVFYAMDG